MGGKPRTSTAPVANNRGATTQKSKRKKVAPPKREVTGQLGLRLEHYRLLLHTPQELDAQTHKQVTHLLLEEGGGSIPEATANEEWSMERIDVVDAPGNTRYQLYLWPFGSGALFAHASTELVANISHHDFAMRVDDPLVRNALASAWQEGKPRLGIEEDVNFHAPEARSQTVAPRGGIAEQIAGLPATEAPNSEPWLEAREHFYQLRDHLFAQWRPYPKLRPAAITADQRALLKWAVPWKLARDLHLRGLFALGQHNARALGLAPSGPSDLQVRVKGELLPLWCAVSDVASGHLEAAPVLAAFQALPPAVALAAWTEIANGEAYDLLEAHPLSPKEVSIPRTTSNVKQRTRLFAWLAAASVHLGARGASAAQALLDDLPEHGRYAQIFIGLIALTRHASANQTSIAPNYDALIPHIRDYRPGLNVFADKILMEIIQGLPRARAAALRDPS